MPAHQATKPRDSPRRQPAGRGVALISSDCAAAWSMHARKLLREAGIAHHDVRLQVEQQRQRVDVGAADRGPVVVDHRHLGMQEGRRVLEDAHAEGQHLVVERARRQRPPAGSRACPAAAGARARHAWPRSAACGGRHGPGRSTRRQCPPGHGRRAGLRCSCVRWIAAGAGCHARGRPRAAAPAPLPEPVPAPIPATAAPGSAWCRAIHARVSALLPSGAGCVRSHAPRYPSPAPSERAA